MSEKKQARKNPFGGIVKYFKEVKSELKKVVWPTFKQIKNNTIIVLVSIVIVGAFIWILDFGFSKSLGTVVEKYGTQSQSQSNTPIDTQNLPIDITEPEGTTDPNATVAPDADAGAEATQAPEGEATPDVNSSSEAEGDVE